MIVAILIGKPSWIIFRELLQYPRQIILVVALRMDLGLQALLPVGGLLKTFLQQTLSANSL
jgi:hypothetical protein